MFKLIQQKRVDILIAQDTHSDAPNAADWAREFDGLAILSHNTSLSGEVTVLFSKHFVSISFHLEEILGRRLLKLRAQFEIHICFYMCL